MIIYPTDGFYLTKEQYSVISNSIQETYSVNEYFFSDIEFAASFIETEKLGTLGYFHEKCQSFIYDEYTSKELLFEYAAYDTHGQWGISVFQDYYAIICGKKDLIERIATSYPNDRDMREFTRFLNSTEVTNENFRESMLELLAHAKTHP